MHFQYIHKSYTMTIFFPITEKLQYAGIVGKIKIDDNKNKNFRVIRVNYLDLGSIVVN